MTVPDGSQESVRHRHVLAYPIIGYWVSSSTHSKVLVTAFFQLRS